MEMSKLTLDIFSKLEKKWLSEWESANTNHCFSPTSCSSKRKTCILSIDGGAGIRGLVSGELLIHLEQQIRSASGNPDARITDFFDLIAGTGINGVLAAMITATDDSTGRPLFSAREAVEFLFARRHRLFRSAGCFLPRRCYDAKFSAASFKKVLREALQGRDGCALTLKDACRPLLIPCYDLNSSAPFVFSRADATKCLSFDFELWEVCRATSATPGLFRPCKLRSVDGSTSCIAVDGGLVMNNPAAAAVTHVLHNKREFPVVSGVEDLLLLSLGSSLPGHRRRSWKKCSGTVVVDIVLDGISEAVDQILSNAFRLNPTNYVRISGGCVGTADDGVEEIRRAGRRVLAEKSVESLPFSGKLSLTETNGERIDAFVRQLVADGFVKDLPPSPTKETAAITVLTDGR